MKTLSSILAGAMVLVTLAAVPGVAQAAHGSGRVLAASRVA